MSIWPTWFGSVVIWILVIGFVYAASQLIVIHQRRGSKTEIDMRIQVQKVSAWFQIDDKGTPCAVIIGNGSIFTLRDVHIEFPGNEFVINPSILDMIPPGDYLIQATSLRKSRITFDRDVVAYEGFEDNHPPSPMDPRYETFKITFVDPAQRVWISSERK